MVIVGASAGRISIVKVSVSVARVSSLTWTVKVKLPAVVGTPKISPEPRRRKTAWSPRKAAVDDLERRELGRRRAAGHGDEDAELGPDPAGHRAHLGVDRARHGLGGGCSEHQSGRTSSNSNFRMGPPGDVRGGLLAPTTSTTGDR